jgi:hypothetical protein
MLTLHAVEGGLTDAMNILSKFCPMDFIHFVMSTFEKMRFLDEGRPRRMIKKEAESERK